VNKCLEPGIRYASLVLVAWGIFSPASWATVRQVRLTSSSLSIPSPVLPMGIRGKLLSQVPRRTTQPLPPLQLPPYEALPNDPAMPVEQPSVSQLSDVKPTDWAYQALRSLSERYGIKLGYPDGTFRGKKTLNRYEYAAALSQVMDKIEALIASSIDPRYVQDDILTLRRLSKEYGDALAEIKTRLDTISDRTAQMESRQFSTTSKLQGQVVTGLTSGNGQHTIVARERLTLVTSFTPQDLLVTQLEAGDNGGDAISHIHNKKQNLLGTTGLIANGGGLDYAEVPATLNIRRLHYTFRPSKNLAVTVGAKMLPRDFIDQNRYAKNEAADFSSSFFLNNPLIVQNQIDRVGGAGAAIAWNPGSGKITVRSLYIAADANQPTGDKGGLFGDRRQGSIEVEYLPSTKIALRLQYTNALINNTDINAVGINAQYALNRKASVFGRFGYGSYQGFNTAIAQNLDLHPYSWAIGLGLRNFFIPGTLAGVAVGQPFVADLGNATQTNLEAFYNLELNDNISVTPTISVIRNANNDSSNGTTWEGTLRTVFSF